MKSLAILAFLFISFILHPSISQCQQPDILQLKNGSILYGTILENKVGEYIRIEVVGKNQLVFPYNEIDKISREETPVLFAPVAKSPIDITTTLNFYGGSNNSAGFQIKASYNLPFRLSVGMGTGIDMVHYQVLPISADVSYVILNSSLSPFIYGRTGFSFPLSKAQSDAWINPEYKGGILAGAGVGIRKSFSNHNAFLFSIGYRYQKLRKITEYYPWYGDTQAVQFDERIDHLNRINISIGFQFN